MFQSRTLGLVGLVAVFIIGAGAVFAQDGDAPYQHGEGQMGMHGGICRPDEEKGAFMTELFGMTIEEIREAVPEDGTIHDLAEELGIDIDSAMEAEHEARLAEIEDCLSEAVANGDLTQEQADMILERAQNMKGEGNPHRRGNGESGFGQHGEGFGPHNGPGQRGEGFGPHNGPGRRGGGSGPAGGNNRGS